MFYLIRSNSSFSSLIIACYILTSLSLPIHYEECLPSYALLWYDIFWLCLWHYEWYVIDVLTFIFLQSLFFSLPRDLTIQNTSCFLFSRKELKSQINIAFFWLLRVFSMYIYSGVNWDKSRIYIQNMRFLFLTLLFLGFLLKLSSKFGPLHCPVLQDNKAEGFPLKF